MHLYTVLLEYAGGTFVCQVKATDEQDALKNWLINLRDRGIAGDCSGEVATAFAGIADNLVPLEGLTNAWCATALTERDLALVNIVRTCD